MTLLVGAMGVKKALEVGTFTGYSALCIALGLAEDGEFIALDIDEEWPSFGRRYWAEAGVGDKVIFRPGPAAQSLNALIDEGHQGRVSISSSSTPTSEISSPTRRIR